MSSSISLISTLMLALSAAIGGAAVARLLRLPMLIGYIAGGVLIGNILPTFANRQTLDFLADAGVTLLLFTLGIQFSFHRLRRILGTVAWAAAFQIILCVLVFLFLFWAGGLGFTSSLIFSLAASLSSTAVLVRILSEKGELDTIPGEVATGWSVTQDLAVVPMMLLLPSLSLIQSGNFTITGMLVAIVLSLVKAGALLVAIVYLGRVGVPKLLGAVASFRSREIFLLSVVGLVFLAALVCAAVGLSAPVGAFIAGLLIAETSQNHAVFSEIRPLRDLFAVVFFVSLGMILPLSLMVSVWTKLLLFTVSVIVMKWFIVMGLARYLGYHRKTAFAVAISLAPVSELGFILAKGGLTMRVLTSDQYVLLVALTFLTIFFSSPLIANTASLYVQFKKLMDHFPRIFPDKEEPTIQENTLSISGHIVICGYGRVGSYIGRALEMSGVPFVVVDYDNATIALLREKGITAVYGDPADKDVLKYAMVDQARALVIAIPDRHTQELIIANAQSLNRRIRIICRTHHEEDQKHLKSLGVQMVVQPEFEAALSIVEKLLSELGVGSEDITGKVTRLKIEHGLG